MGGDLTGLLREEARAQGDDTGFVALPRAPGLALFGLLVGIVAVAGAVVVFAIPFPDVATATGVLAPRDEARRVVANARGRVADLPIEVGALVQAGDVVAVLEAGVRALGGENPAQVQVEALRSQIAGLQSERESLQLESSGRQAALAEDARRLSVDLDRSRRLADIALEREQLVAQQVQQMEHLVAAGYGAELELTRRREALLAARGEREMAQGRTTEAEARLVGLRRDQMIAPLELDRQLSDIDRRLAALRSELAGAMQEAQTVIRAPTAGVVARLLADPGDYVEMGAPLAALSPQPTDRNAVFRVEAGEVGAFPIGAQAAVSVAAFPPSRFGTIPVRIVAIVGPIAPERVGQPTDVAPRQFDVIVEILEDDETLASRGFRLVSGMPVELQFSTGTRSLWDRLASPAARG